MSSIDWDGNLTHSNYKNKKQVTTKRAAASKKAVEFFDSDDESDFVVMLPKPKPETTDDIKETQPSKMHVESENQIEVEYEVPISDISMSKRSKHETSDNSSKV